MLPTTLFSKSGASLQVGYDFDTSFEKLLENRQADCFILATEYGFSPLGLAGDVIASELGVSSSEIVQIADWNRNKNKDVSLIGIKKKAGSQPGYLKGCVLAASETSVSYEQFEKGGAYTSPSRDFFYNVTYEAIYYAVHTLKARKLTISHLSASGNYHENIATCTAEALGHFHDEFPGLIDSFLFVGCCIKPEHFNGIKQLNSEGNITKHKPIKVKTEQRRSFDIMSLETVQLALENQTLRTSFVVA